MNKSEAVNNILSSYTRFIREYSTGPVRSRYITENNNYEIYFRFQPTFSQDVNDFTTNTITPFFQSEIASYPDITWNFSCSMTSGPDIKHTLTVNF